MYGPDGPDTFWLNFTNIALGRGDDHAFATPGLGVTMADGGERLEKDKASDPKPR
jgi:hypothetical protein